jgi:proteasome accessory factor B
MSIIGFLRSRNRTYNDIFLHLSRQFEMKGFEFNYSIRTFQRDVNDILSHFNIEIKCDRKTNTYYIAQNNGEEYAQQSTALLNAFEIADMINYSKQYNESVLFETRKPSGLEHFYTILQSIRENKILLLQYQKFIEDSISNRQLIPLALKESQNRWYLVAMEQNIIKTFALDRILDCEISKSKFSTPNIDVKAYFSNYFGVNTTGKKVEKVKILAQHNFWKYIDTFPLHHSQRKIEQNEENTLFELNIIITPDFVYELVKLSDMLIVIKPAHLSKLIQQHCIDILNKYQ